MVLFFFTLVQQIKDYKMTLEEFKSCKIGDRILSSTGKISYIEDINRTEGKITVGSGKWRSYKIVRLPTLEIIKTERHKTPSDFIVLSKKLLFKYGLPQTLIMQVIENAGSDGFVGSSSDLAQCTEFVSEEYTRNLLAVMCRQKIIHRKLLSRGIYCFTLSK